MTDESHPLRLDADAQTGDPDLPAFLARPDGAPVYHGFPLLDDVEAEGFRLGMITDWETEQTDSGDAFVEGPDGRRAGLVWSVDSSAQFHEVLPPDRDRNGVWAVSFPFPMRSRDDARRNLTAIVPELKRRWA